jgi:hypothetical protein
LDERGGAKDTEHDGDIQKVRLNVSIEWSVFVYIVLYVRRESDWNATSTREKGSDVAQWHTFVSLGINIDFKWLYHAS